MGGKKDAGPGNYDGSIVTRKRAGKLYTLLCNFPYTFFVLCTCSPRCSSTLRPRPLLRSPYNRPLRCLLPQDQETRTLGEGVLQQAQCPVRRAELLPHADPQVV